MTLSSLQAQASRVILSGFSPSNCTEKRQRENRFASFAAIRSNTRCVPVLHMYGFGKSALTSVVA